MVSPEERSALFAALPLRVRLVAETLYVTGARVSEVLTVRRDQVKVNGANGTVELRLYGKGGKERTARIPAELYKRILQVFPKGTYLFESSHKKHFRREYISREIARAARRVLGGRLGARAAPLAGDGPAGEHEEDQGGLEAAWAQRRGDHAEVLCARRVQRRGPLRGKDGRAPEDLATARHAVGLVSFRRSDHKTTAVGRRANWREEGFGRSRII